MLKRIVFIVVILVFAKPVYHTVTEYINDSPVVSDSISSIATTVNDLKEEYIEKSDTGPTATNASTSTVTTDVESLAAEFYRHFQQFDGEFEIVYKGDTTNLEKILEQATKLATEQDDYIGGHISDRSIQYSYRSNDAKISVSQQYLTNVVQETAVEEVVMAILKEVQWQTMSDFEKVKFANDYIVTSTVYSEQSNASPHSAYAASIEGKAVCQGYALFITKLLRAMNVDVLYVVGQVNTGGHAWNLVKIDGNWYHLDATWNDPLPDRGNQVSYDYFLINDRQMQQDHSWETANYPASTNSYVY